MHAFDLKIARDFFNTYKIQHIDNSTYLLTDANHKLLVKTHLIDPNDKEIHEEVLNVLDMHLSLNQRYVAPLIHFQSCQEGVRAIYRMDSKTLKDEVAERMQEKRYFQQQELWVLLSSLVDSLEYLQQKGVTYGVLSSSKIFVQQKIRLLDPSSYNLAPINTSRLSYHSPQFLQTQNPIDFNQSDVYLLGLCLLQAASLAHISNKLTEQDQNLLIEQVSTQYSSEIVHVLKHLLRRNPEERPTFINIQQYIETEIQITSQKYWEAQPLPLDNQDQISCGLQLSNQSQQQFIDILEPAFEFIKYKKLTQYQRVKQKVFFSPLKQFNDAGKRLQTTKSSMKDSSCDSKTRKGNKKDENCHSIVQQFKLQLGQTVNHRKRASRAVQIKNRNAQQVRKLEPLQMIRNECTNQSLMNEIQFETERAKKYLHLVNPTS